MGERQFQRDSQTYAFLWVSLVGVRDNTKKTKSLTSCFSAWAKKADVDTEGALLAALDTKEEIPIIPYSSLFILSSENKYENNNNNNDNNDDPKKNLRLFLILSSESKYTLWVISWISAKWNSNGNGIV